ncbi:MAG TPA: hypothetical protein VIK40_11595 [Geomonas sp.]
MKEMMREFIYFMKGALDSQRSESYTRCAGFTTLYFYLLWATYRISGGCAIKDVDIPPTLAAFLFALYGFGAWIKSKKEVTIADPLAA